MKIGIIGYGHVGTAMKDLFTDAIIYDKFKKIGTIDKINKCDIAFICVPTPMNKDGSCDASIVEEVIKWCKAKVIVIRSTVYIGFTDKMIEKYHKKIVFQPEYYGETVNHPFAILSNRNWLSFGGSREDVNFVIRAYQQVMTSNIRILIGTPKEAEWLNIWKTPFLPIK